MPYVVPAAILPTYPGMAQTLCYAGLHTRGLNSTITTLTEAGTKYTREMASILTLQLSSSVKVKVADDVERGPRTALSDGSNKAHAKPGPLCPCK